MSTYKLYYLNGRGRAEISRLIFTATDQKFEDIRYERDQWRSHKAEMPLGEVPVLEFDGNKLPQSISIARFLAKQFQLAGKDNFEQAKVDAVADTINDAFTKDLEVLGKLYGNGSPYFVGNNLTWADLFFYAVSEHFLESAVDCLNNSPWLKQNRTEVEKQPRIAEYLKNRPKTRF